jgi:ABC-type amino acid transport substrate-binding protein
MRQFLVCVVAAAFSLVASFAWAQAPNPRTEVRKGLVAVLTDGIADPGSRATQAINQLAAYAAHMPNVRVLPISGHGAAENVRDLLYLRGVDLAVLNSDVLAFLDQTGQYPDARKRLRYVTHLYDQKVFLLVRNGINTIEDLRGRRLAVVSEAGAGRVTARALFGLSRIDVVVDAIGPGESLDDATVARFDGALLLSDDLARARPGARMRQEYHLLPIPMTPDLQKAYRGAVIDAQEAAGFSSAENVETVAVSALLAVFNWAPTQGRYADVANFISALYLNLKGLRQPANSIWRQADISASSPGWTRFPAFLPHQVLTPAQVAELAFVERPVSSLAPAAGPALATDQRIKRIRVLAAERAPLADRHLPDGGLIAALVNASLRMADQRDGGRSDIDMNWTSTLPTIERLQSESGIDLSLPWETADCEQPNDLAQASAVLCDDVLYSEPVLQLVIGLFALSDGGFEFGADDSIFGKSICVPLDRDASILNSDGRKWLSDKRISMIRRPTLLDCISLVQQREADAFVASDLEGRYTLGQLGLSKLFKMMERPLGTRGVHVIVPKDRPQAEELVNAVNQGLRQLKQSDAYASLIRQHLMKLWNTQASTP